MLSAIRFGVGALLPLVCALLFACSGLPASAETAPGGLTAGARAGDDVNEYFGDALIPVFQQENRVLFLNGRASWAEIDIPGDYDSEDENNVGIGYRQLFGDAVIVGANIFRDTRATLHEGRVDQWGAGMEILSSWVDFRANFYGMEDDPYERTVSTGETVSTSTRTRLGDPYVSGTTILQDHTRIRATTTTREFVTYTDEPMPGGDAELGVRIPYLPQWLETRVFGGYYEFRSDIGRDFSGAKGRLEIRPLPAIQIDAEIFDDKDLNGTTDYFVGLRLRLPLDLIGGVQMNNPFRGLARAFTAGSQSLNDRLTEMVIRDFRIRMQYFSEGGSESDTDTNTETTTDVLGTKESPPEYEGPTGQQT